jgi:hypothetical protein
MEQHKKKDVKPVQVSMHIPKKAGFEQFLSRNAMLQSAGRSAFRS